MTRELTIENGDGAALPATQAPMTPMELLEKATMSGASPEALGQLMALQERWEANQAKKAFVAALAAFKANPPKVFKNHEVDFSTSKGRTRYKHATLDNVCAVLDSALPQHGLSYRWETDIADNGKVRVTCILQHVMGHSERTALQSVIDTTGNKNDIQAVGSAVTYLQRYTLLAATGIAVQGQDDDGAKSQKEDGPINEKQLAELNGLAGEVGADKAKFCQWLGVPSLADIPQSQFNRAKTALEKKRQA